MNEGFNFSSEVFFNPKKLLYFLMKFLLRFRCEKIEGVEGWMYKMYLRSRISGINKSVNQSINPSIIQSTSESNLQSTSKSIIKLINFSFDEAIINGQDLVN